MGNQRSISNRNHHCRHHHHSNNSSNNSHQYHLHKESQTMINQTQMSEFVGRLSTLGMYPTQLPWVWAVVMSSMNDITSMPVIHCCRGFLFLTYLEWILVQKQSRKIVTTHRAIGIHINNNNNNNIEIEVL